MWKHAPHPRTRNRPSRDGNLTASSDPNPILAPDLRNCDKWHARNVFAESCPGSRSGSPRQSPRVGHAIHSAIPTAPYVEWHRGRLLQLEKQQVGERGLGAFDLRRKHRLAADIGVKENVRLGGRSVMLSSRPRASVARSNKRWRALDRATGGSGGNGCGIKAWTCSPPTLVIL